MWQKEIAKIHNFFHIATQSLRQVEKMVSRKDCKVTRRKWPEVIKKQARTIMSGLERMPLTVLHYRVWRAIW